MDEEWGSSGDPTSPVYDDATNHYRNAEGVWHENINVERGQSTQRLDLDSGFMRSIVSPHLINILAQVLGKVTSCMQ